MVNQENGVDLKSATQSDERKLFIETYGCQMNVADSEVVASIMKMDGYSMTENIEEADAIFVNTCSVRDNAEQKIYGRLQYFQSLKRKKKSLIVGDIVRYGRPLFNSVEDERFPVPVIMPLCLTGDDISEVTFENFGKEVRLYLWERNAA